MNGSRSKTIFLDGTHHPDTIGNMMHYWWMTLRMEMAMDRELQRQKEQDLANADRSVAHRSTADASTLNDPQPLSDASTRQQLEQFRALVAPLDPHFRKLDRRARTGDHFTAVLITVFALVGIVSATATEQPVVGVIFFLIALYGTISLLRSILH